MALGRGDVEGVGVLEDLGVGLVADDETVDGSVTKVRRNVPGIRAGRVGDTACERMLVNQFVQA